MTAEARKAGRMVSISYTRSWCLYYFLKFLFKRCFTSFRTAVQQSDISTVEGTRRKKNLCFPCPDRQGMSKTLLDHSALFAMMEHPADATDSSSEEASEEEHWLLKANVSAAKVLSPLCGCYICLSCLNQRKAKGLSVNGIQEILTGCLWRQDRS